MCAGVAEDVRQLRARWAEVQQDEDRTDQAVAKSVTKSGWFVEVADPVAAADTAGREFGSRSIRTASAP
ncbi:hypothetical protein HBB16_06665 [Pseudonocardia sp. MCCB 268]|nr:hypothetical protein [Pseudonocardia cytotoxica]